MIAEIQCLPTPMGTLEEPYRQVDAAIAVIARSGLTYEVHALGTVVEGPPDAVWALVRAVHEATLDAGADRTISVVKVAQSIGDDGAATMADLTAKHRAQP